MDRNVATSDAIAMKCENALCRGVCTGTLLLSNHSVYSLNKINEIGTKVFMKRKRPVIVTAILALFIALFPANPASADTRSWWTLCAGYTGASWYNSSRGIAYASTTASDNDKVGVSIRYYQGSTNYTTANGYVLQSRAAVSYGGYHRSYCGVTLTHWTTI